MSEKIKVTSLPCRWGDCSRPVTLRLAIGLINELDRLAKESNRSRTNVMRILLEYGVANTELD